MYRARDKNLARMLLVTSLMTLGLLIYSAYDENVGADWNKYQGMYKAELLARAASDRERMAAERFDVRQKQIYLPHLSRVDRCVTCHVAVDDPAMKDAPQPLTAHPGDILLNHPKERFGCVMCHQGQGRATHQEDAHGHVPHWFEPLRKPEEMDVSCPKCHTEPSLPGADRYNFAMQIVEEKGCLYCHRLRGRGGDIGPDISAAGKTHDAEWHFKHFKDPKSVVETSEMPDLKLTDEETHALVYLMMSLQGDEIPVTMLSNPKLKAPEVDLEAVDPLAAKGYVGSRVCLGCHESLTPDEVDGWRKSPMSSTFDRIRDEPDNQSCLRCHATGYNPHTGHYSEESVGCEGCHGPGREAVKLVLEGRVDEHKKKIGLGHDAKLVCKACHNPHVPAEGHEEFYRRKR